MIVAVLLQNAVTKGKLPQNSIWSTVSIQSLTAVVILQFDALLAQKLPIHIGDIGGGFFYTPALVEDTGSGADGHLCSCCMDATLHVQHPAVSRQRTDRRIGMEYEARVPVLSVATFAIY